MHKQVFLGHMHANWANKHMTPNTTKLLLTSDSRPLGKGNVYSKTSNGDNDTLNIGAYPCHGTCRGTLSNAPPPPPLCVMVAQPAQPAQVTQVPITLTQHDIAAAPCDTTHPMWRHRGTARPEPPPPPRRGVIAHKY